jgi:hypothetical protein
VKVELYAALELHSSHPTNKKGNCGRKAGRGKGDDECYSETKLNWSWGMLPGDQRRVTSPQRLEQPM